MSFLNDVFAGGAAGASAVLFLQPLIYRKNVAQGNVPLQRSVAAHFRGAGGVALSFVPTVALQSGAQACLREHMDPLLAAILAGGASSLVVCPAEGAMIRQQMEGVSYRRAMATLWKTGNLFRAFTLTAGREGGFAGAYLGLAPLLKERLQEKGMQAHMAQLLAGVAAGVVSATLGQPLDTLKTRMQQDLSWKVRVVKEVCQKGAFAGLSWRVVMTVVAVTWIPFAKERVKEKFV